MRQYTFIDKCCFHLDTVVRTLNNSHKSVRNPVKSELDTADFTEKEKKHIAALMRINHTGEVCAQALYQGQSITAKNSDTRALLKQSQEEEIDHLAWCAERVHQVGGHTSYLNPLWYLGALSIGMTFGLIGDKTSLGFLAETEKQVVKHLESHLEILPKNDTISRKIVNQMIVDEANHAHTATSLGGVPLLAPIPTLMKYSAKIMTGTTYYI